MNWFNVDKEGLAKLLERKGGKQFAIFELIQNAWDENTTTVKVFLSPVEGKRQYKLIVADDNPEGFKDLSHAFTLFAESTKKANPEKRGRFNLGEKLVLAVCDEAEISTTCGTVLFDSTGRHSPRRHTDRGSVFQGLLRASKGDYEAICKAVTTLLPPANITTTFNDKIVAARTPVAEVTIPLATEIADTDGMLRRTVRKTTIKIYDPRDGETPALYEMGIPVVEMPEDDYHADVSQKVPLNFDRDNVPPSYLQDIRTAVLNATFADLSPESATKAWVRDASSDPNCSPDAIKKVINLRFGDKVVAFDPSDPEGTKIAMSKGYTVVSGGTLSAGEWDNVRATQSILPAGQVTPSPKPFSESGRQLKKLDNDKWTPEIKQTAQKARDIAYVLLRTHISVHIANDFGWPFAGSFGPDGFLTLNLSRLGYNWFDWRKNRESIIGLLLHEFAHYKVSDHLSNAFADECTRLGAKLTEAALSSPMVFK